jgi:hypothetical protein
MLQTPTLPPPVTPPDPNKFNWSGFYKTEDDAEKCFREKIKVILKNEKKVVISAKKELQINGKKCHDLLLYKFTVITNDEK